MWREGTNMNCLECDYEFTANEKRAAGIAIMVLGDEYIFSYWCCPKCQKCSVESYHDRFMGEDDITYMGPFAKVVGERCVALVEKCPNPMDKYCDCQSHKALYYGVPRD